ncbi:hypothetical protein [Endozoicomonas numazuensis]|uniref:N-acetyltransferase domain-containing protein n=1 Tax=Endozoicomonas numazuensis TaxID=1137799 RepID=A0A081NGG6_9GAMM|nr:hypothetical protein [Endozoicomonas numazuensis]KEQ17539.1 hypothetical protein GZ78_17495 [Endozoicomonas numazuensis]
MKEIEKFCDDLNSFLVGRFNYKESLAHADLSNNISAKRKAYDLYLRYKPKPIYWKEDTIVIARIFFHKTKVGSGKSFLKFLVEHSNKYCYKYIAIESMNENSKQFSDKFGFKEYKEPKNAIISIKKLRNILENYE